jgi:hypothetical protein
MQSVVESAELHSQQLQDGMTALVESRTATMRSIWDTGVEFVQAAQQTRDIVVDGAFESRGVLSEEWINDTIERVDGNLQSSEGGKLFSSALDAGVWIYNVKEGAEYTGQMISDGVEGSSSADWGAVRDAVIENERKALLWQGPIGYASDRAVRLFQGLQVEAGEVIGKIDSAIGDARQLQSEYEEWRADGNEWWEAGLLTAVGDDDFVSRTEAARNAAEGLPLEASNLVETVRHSGVYDPAAAVMFTGILNDRDKAGDNVGVAARFALQYRGEEVPIDLVYNSTHSSLYDLAQVQLVNKLDLIDETTRAGIADVRMKIWDENRNRSKPVEVFAHSQGAAIASSVLSHLTPEERAQVAVTTFGGAAYRFPEGLASLEAIVNNQDMVPSLFGAGVPFLDDGEGYNDSNYNVVYVDIGDAGNWSTSHNLENYSKAYERRGESRWEAAVRRFFFEDSQP